VKVSLPEPPVRFWTPAKVAVLAPNVSRPAFLPVICQPLFAAGPISVLFPLLLPERTTVGVGGPPACPSVRLVPWVIKVSPPKSPGNETR
jgi:hypothetical protein